MVRNIEIKRMGLVDEQVERELANAEIVVPKKQ
jgi:hypothetical protein